MTSEHEFNGNEWEIDGDGLCNDCGGEGIAEYDNHPEAWGEDCPSARNHWITCPNCGGSGKLEDCKYG